MVLLENPPIEFYELLRRLLDGKFLGALSSRG